MDLYHRAPSPSRRPLQGTSGLRSALGLALALVALPTAAAAQAAKADQVFRIDPRNGNVVAVKGIVKTHGLERIEIERRDGKELRLDSSEVVDVVFGDVPPSFTDARRYLKRGNFENAVARYRVAAGDAAARPVVQARARLGAAETLMQWGATDPTRFREAAEEAERFVSSFAEDRNVPGARALLGRAQWLAGDAAAAAVTLEALFKTGQAGTAGYPRLLTLEAGLDAVHACLAAGKLVEGRALADELTSALAAAPRDGLSAGMKARLDSLSEVGALSSGFVLLAEGKGDRAEAFFSGQVDSAKTGPGRNAARLGLGEALLLQKKFRAAQLALASASALTYSDLDREARAQFGLGLAYRELGDDAEAKACFERVVRQYGATPAAARAAAELKAI